MAESISMGASRMSNDVKRGANDLKQSAQDEIQALRERVEALMAERVTPALADVADRAEQAAKGAGDYGRAQAQRLSDNVKDQPLAAIGVAALAGFFLALLVKR